MFREYLILFLLAHIIADFYIQTEKMSEKKNDGIRWVLIHCAYYLGIMLLCILPVISNEIISGAIIAALFHLLIDMIKFMCISVINKKGKMSKIIERNVFFAD